MAAIEYPEGRTSMDTAYKLQDDSDFIECDEFDYDDIFLCVSELESSLYRLRDAVLRFRNDGAREEIQRTCRVVSALNAELK